jgi:hypothetical protein
MVGPEVDTNAPEKKGSTVKLTIFHLVEVLLKFTGVTTCTPNTVWLMRQKKGKMIQPTTSFMFVENVKQVVKHALMILLALHLIIGHLGT